MSTGFKRSVTLLTLAAITTAGYAQNNADYRIRAVFRVDPGAPWAAGQSIGHAEFRVHSRFGHVYYGGVYRLDDYKFTVQIDYRDVSGFDTMFAGSMFDTDCDVYINSGFVGRVFMGTEAAGLAELIYDSRHPTFPELPLPVGFPDPVELFDLVTVFPSAGDAPAIGDQAPQGTPMFSSELIEEFARGDANLDGKVDEDDYAILASQYDPFHLLGEHIGPMAGDFTADNQSDRDDYETLLANWTDSHDAPPEPDAVATPCAADLAEPFGILDLADINTFVTAFAGQDALADLDGNGLLDLGDVNAFVVAFTTGCP
ncbi:MAG: hypothetical protein H6810_07405 [Phycisphaeraceae bacterium]|nr:MAG: hypothetical protein H6810_07405 [Phycisphaeraceae bacterium]